ncbi:AAA family ATPase [Paenibacillus turpanensis]|uniref:AAA family ATPase n=1 Tax=Paenibacillus turpanensis TaxID=2689078 RepID=UPI00140E0554|nr:AAA family ATPase [Paenibacillus turpanensis]
MRELNQIELAAAKSKEGRPYSHIWEHYADELERLDLQLQLIYLRRQELTPDPQTDSYRGMFVSEEEFWRLSGGMAPAAENSKQLEATVQRLKLSDAKIEGRLAASKGHVYLPLLHAADIFGLCPIEQRMVMVTAAVELDRKYERIFGFLQDDLTLKLPTISLVLQLVCRTAEERMSAAMAFAPTGMLARFFWPQCEQETAGRSMLSQPLKLDRRIVMFLVNPGAFNDGLMPAARLYAPDEVLQPLFVHQEVQEKLQVYLRKMTDSRFMPEQGEFLPCSQTGIYLWGKAGAGKKLQARHASRALNKPLLIADLSLLIFAPSDADFIRLLQELIREAMLHQAVLGFTGLECLCPEETDTGISARYRSLFFQAMDQFSGILVLMGDRAIRLQGEATGRIWLDAELPVPHDRQREDVWHKFAEELMVQTDIDWMVLGGKFRFTPGQIRRSLLMALERTLWKHASESTKCEVPALGQERWITREALIEACYSQTQHKLERKAARISPRYSWDDLVLPREQRDQLLTACNQMKYRAKVYGSWGFDRKLAYGKGLSMLFAGPPGTGKTMSAQVVAKELELELYKIDLSQVISKYIGETEKNLHEIFLGAESSQAVLFFDETDALFGKRSEVKDSRDKYANIETAYLLQKMEEYEGVSILATNLLQNIDEAFLRRINYIIKYPFPDAVFRESLWRNQFPTEAPVSEDVDFHYLGRKFEIAGGNIKNAALTAAFLAASKNETIGMRHIIQAVKQELQKTGKIIENSDWDEF